MPLSIPIDKHFEVADRSRRFSILRRPANFDLHGLGVFVAGLELVGDQRRYSAVDRVSFNISDDVDFRLSEIRDQLAGFVWWRVPLVGGLNQLGALYRLFSQRNISIHAGVR